jgi:hypothetical protein
MKNFKLFIISFPLLIFCLFYQIVFFIFSPLLIFLWTWAELFRSVKYDKKMDWKRIFSTLLMPWEMYMDVYEKE